MIIKIDSRSAQPIYEQLRDQIVYGIANARLVPGEPLPSVRRLAADLGINFHTVSKAYALLCDDGYIAIDRRKGAIVLQAEGGQNFVPKLTAQLEFCAAQAVCHQMTLDEFLHHCRACYAAQKGEKAL